GAEKIQNDRVLDTLKLARNKYPGSPASLDALSRRFRIDLSKRSKHGALLDSQILAEVYLELVGGRQPGLELISTQTRNTNTTSNDGTFKREVPLPSFLTDSEKKAHDTFIKLLGEKCLWTKGTN
ncbi:MAG: exonuclease domain-containing protein, partial [Paracoccaceae bacterium]